MSACLLYPHAQHYPIHIYQCFYLHHSLYKLFRVHQFRMIHIYKHNIALYIIHLDRCQFSSMLLYHCKKNTDCQVWIPISVPSLSSFLYKKRILTTYHFDHKIFWRESYHMLHYFLNVSGKSEAMHYGMAIEYRRYSLWGVLLPFWYHHFDGLYSQYPRHRVGTPHSSNLYLVRYMGGQTYETIFDTYPVQASWHFDDHIWIWWCCYPVRIMLPLPKLLPVSSLHLIPSCSSWPCSEDNRWSYQGVCYEFQLRQNGHVLVKAMQIARSFLLANTCM